MIPYLLMALSALAMPGSSSRSTATPPGYVSETLDNGLRVSILPDPANPVVATQLWYHVGSANEDPGSRGFAHLFEHLMFGDTETHGKDAFARHHSDHGGEDNAYTSWDETVYVSAIPAEHHEPVLVMEADRMVRLVLHEENLANEQRIVSEELRLSMENDPFSRVMIAALKAVLGEHPYAWTPGGTREDVAAATLERCRDFYARYYKPRNAHLVIVGPVDAADTLAAVRRHFGPIEAGGTTPDDVPPLIEHEFVEDVVLREDLPPVETAMLAFALPPAAHPDRWALEVLQQLLAGGTVDRFEESIVKRRRKAVYAMTEWLEMRRGGALIFGAAHLPYRRKATAFRLGERVLDELLGFEWLGEEELAAAKRALVREELERTYFAERRAEAIGQAAWWLGDEGAAFDAAQRIDAVTREDVERVFRRYVADATPARLYLKPERVPLWVRLFGWLYPLVNR